MLYKKSLRRSLLAFTLAAVTTLVPRPAFAAGYSVVVNGRTVPAYAEVRSGQLMVPIRSLVEAMGGTVAWNPTAKMASVSYRGSQLAVWIGNTLGFQNGRKIWSPVAPYGLDGSTMVPGHWLAARLGAKVSYSGSTLNVSTGSATATTAAANPNPRPDHVLANPAYVFPFPAGASHQQYEDGMGDPRYYGGDRFAHEGIDIAAPSGTPIVAAAGGTVVRYGWNTLGGYRLTIQLADQPAWKMYYAHLESYAPGLYLGARVKTGQLIGYVGSTGEGPEGTEGKFVSHLHFGLYDANFDAADPYYLLRYWEGNKVSLQ